MSLDRVAPAPALVAERPDWIPYRTSYYRRAWGFCLAHRDLASLAGRRVRGRDRRGLAPGSLTYAECRVAGTSEREVIVYTHTCHPSLANDNPSGIAVAAVLAEELRADAAASDVSLRLRARHDRLADLARAQRGALAARRGGLVIGLLGDRAR